jgi:hypothetical protein
MPFTATAYIPSIKPGIYPAICTGVEERSPKADPGNIFRVWTFQLTDGSLRSVDGSSSLSTSPKSKGGKWAAALIGHFPEVGEEIAPEGLPCTIIVAIKDTTGYEYVETVAPPTEAPSRVAAGEKAAATHAAQEGDEVPTDQGGALPF